MDIHTNYAQKMIIACKFLEQQSEGKKNGKEKK